MKHAALSIFYIFLIVVAVINLPASQQYPQAMIQMIKHPTLDEAFTFLDSIKQTPYYLEQYRLLNGLTQGRIGQKLEERNEIIVTQIDEYEKILTKSPENPQILRQLAYLYKNHGELEKAAELQAKAQKIDPR